MNYAGETYPIGFPVEFEAAQTGVVQVATPKALAIVGSHPATREKAPYEDPRFEIWLFNEAPMKPEVYRRWDASFQMHKPEVYASEHNWVNQDHWHWLQQDHGGKTIWMQDVDARVPNSAKYPLDEILALVPYKYLRSTPALALALGVYLGYKEIHLYGSELSSNTEYTYQAINYAFWVGFALGYGVDLQLQCWLNEFNQPIYGYEGEVQLPQAYFTERIERIEIERKAKAQALRKAETQLDKAFEKNDFQKVADLSLVVESLHNAVGEIEGAMDEAQRYAARTNPISRQEFERVSAQSQKDGSEAEHETWHAAGRCEYIWNVWYQTGNLQAKNQLKTFLAEKNKAAHKAGILSGKFSENYNNLSEYDKVVVAAGGYRAVYQAQGNDNGQHA